MVAKANFKFRRQKVFFCFVLFFPPRVDLVLLKCTRKPPARSDRLVKNYGGTATSENRREAKRVKRFTFTFLLSSEINGEKCRCHCYHYHIHFSNLVLYQSVTNNRETKYLDFWASGRMEFPND